MIRKIAAFLFLVFLAPLAFAQGFPSRPSFLSAGVGCNPNSFALNYIMAPTTNGFVCIGGYPQTSGGTGTLYFIAPAQGITSVASIKAIDTGGDTTLALYAGNNQGIEIATDSLLLGSESMNFVNLSGNVTGVFGIDDAGADTANLIWQADQSQDTNKAGFVLVSDGAGSATFRMVTWNSNTGLVDTILADAVFSETTGDPSSWVLNFPAVAFNNLANNSAYIQENGGTSAPPYSFVSNTNSGMWNDSGNLNFAVNGSEQFEISQSSVDIKNNTLTSSDGTVDITGNLTFTGTCSSCSAASGVYGGFVDAAAAAENVPTGWSVSLASTCLFTVTHNLALSPSSDLAISATTQDGSTNSGVIIDSIGANSFVLETSNAAGDSCEAHAHMFTAIVVAN